MDKQHNYETQRRQLTYSEVFKELIKTKPGLLRTFLKLADQLVSEPDMAGNDPITESELTLTLFDYKPYLSVFYFKAQIAGHLFFIKQALKEYHSGGFHEAQSTQRANELLQKAGLADYVIIPEFKMGYSDQQKTYYVSDWEPAIDLQPLDVYNISLWYTHLELVDNGKIESEEHRQLMHTKMIIDERVNYIQGALTDFFDVNTNNMAIDPETNRIYLYDLNEKTVEWSTRTGIQ